MASKITHVVVANVDGAGWRIAGRATSERGARAINTRLHNRVQAGEHHSVETRILPVEHVPADR